MRTEAGQFGQNVEPQVEQSVEHHKPEPEHRDRELEPHLDELEQLAHQSGSPSGQRPDLEVIERLARLGHDRSDEPMHKEDHNGNAAHQLSAPLEKPDLADPVS